MKVNDQKQAAQSAQETARANKKERAEADPRAERRRGDKPDAFEALLRKASGAADAPGEGKGLGGDALGAPMKEGAPASLASDVLMQRDALRGEQDAQATLTARASAKQESALEGEVREDDDQDLRWRAEAVDAPVMEQARTDQVANAPAQVNGASGMTAEQARVHEIAQRLVKAVHVGQDQRARKVVMMDVEVPGYGNLRARLTRQGDGIEVRLRAEDPALSRLLRSQRGTLADQARANGVTLRQIDVVDSGDL